MAPSEILGKRVLVFDDIATTGAPLDAAKLLLNEGADRVEGLVLPRTQWPW